MAEHAVGVEIVTPEAALFAGPANSVVLATSEGDLTVMAEHAELIGDVVPGLVKIEPVEGDQIDVVIHGGFVQITTSEGAGGELLPDSPESARTPRVTILAGVAELVSELDVPRAREAQVAAEARVTELRAANSRQSEEEMGDAMAELANAEADLARAELRLSIPASQV